MPVPLSERILRGLEQAAPLYHRLIIVAAPSGTGKTAAMLDVHTRLQTPLINVNLELSRQMLDLTERQRALQLPQLLGEIVNNQPGDCVLLDNIELLFDVSLKQDPLRLLQGISRQKTVVVAWGGAIEGETLIYAVPEHPEYRRYPVRDFLTVTPDTTL